MTARGEYQTYNSNGFGDITPVTPQGRLVVCASILAGVAVIPAQAASLLDAILEYQNEGKLKQSSLAEAEINVLQIPPRVTDETKTKVVSPSKEKDKSNSQGSLLARKGCVWSSR